MDPRQVGPLTSTLAVPTELGLLATPVTSGGCSCWMMGLHHLLFLGQQQAE